MIVFMLISPLVVASCASKGICRVSKTATGVIMGNGGAIEVSREAGSTILDLCSGMISDQRKLQFLQAYLKGQYQ